MGRIQSTSPIIVVANRLPFVLQKNKDGNLERKQSAGGLVTAVAPVIVETGGLWIGWPGLFSDAGPIVIPEANPNDKSPTAGLKSNQVLAIDVDRQMYDNYYNGCCNATFWPLFHSMPDRALFQQDKWEAYRIANDAYANLTFHAIKLMKEKSPSAVPLVWIHDYHLMLAAGLIRELCEQEGLEIKMAFFLHIPFPSWDIFRLFPWDDAILQGILGCDSIGFHIEDYCFNFIDCCQRRLGCYVDRKHMLVEHCGRTVTVHPLPISIPYERFMNLALESDIVVKNHPDEKIILGVDRLDYTKGLVHRIKAFERLLEKYPEHLNVVTFLQVAVPSRTDVKEYRELKEELDQLIGSVNGRFTSPNWSPIRYIYGCISQEQLSAFYRDASVAVVTPLRDGMNLVAKEYVACQVKEPGVLMLSPFAGAGSTMQEALMVNPYETEEFADVLHRALTMSLDERELRMKQLRRREKERDVNFWLESFLKTVDCLGNDPTMPRRTHPLGEEDFDHFLSNAVDEASRLALLLDYDGTLAPIAPHPDLAVIPTETKKVLERLANMPDVNIAIISGRSIEDVKKMVGIEGITYAGSHGLQILHPDGSQFVHPVPPEYEVNLAKLIVRLAQNACKHGAWVEDKGAVITFHYREVPPEHQEEIVKCAQDAFVEFEIPIHQSRMAFEARPPVTWDKGRAALYILRSLFGVDWCDRVATVFAGDDLTDEDAMRALQGMAVTFRITANQNIRTAATHRLPNTDAILTMLKWIERRLSCRLPNPIGHRSRTSSMSKNSGNNSPIIGSPSLMRHKMVANMMLSESEFKTVFRKTSAPPANSPVLPRKHGQFMRSTSMTSGPLDTRQLQAHLNQTQ